jgi:putative tryptophan/tyrosine transport system substrate-binding protein
MDRRRFLLTSLAGAVAIPLAARAQQSGRVPRLCFVTFDPGTAASPSPRFASFFQELRDLGYEYGRNITIDYLAADGRSEQFPELVTDCLRLNANVIAVTTTPAAQAAKAATRSVPIVMVAVGDPVGTGLVESLARPGGNLTGMSQMTSVLAGKRLELLKAAVPKLSRVLVLSYLVDPIAPLQIQALREMAPSVGVTLLVHDIKTADDLATAFDAGVKEHVEGIMTTAESIFRLHRGRVTELAARHRLPGIYPYSAFVRDANGLMAYQIDDADLHRRAAT